MKWTQDIQRPMKWTKDIINIRQIKILNDQRTTHEAETRYLLLLGRGWNSRTNVSPGRKSLCLSGLLSSSLDKTSSISSQIGDILSPSDSLWNIWCKTTLQKIGKESKSNLLMWPILIKIYLISFKYSKSLKPKQTNLTKQAI